MYISLFGMSMCKVDKYWHIRMIMPGMSLWGRYHRMPWQKFTEKCSAPWAESVSSWWLKLLSKFWFIVCYIYGEKTLLSTKHCITGLTLKMTRLCDKNFWLFIVGLSWNWVRAQVWTLIWDLSLAIIWILNYKRLCPSVCPSVCLSVTSFHHFWFKYLNAPSQCSNSDINI